VFRRGSVAGEPESPRPRRGASDVEIDDVVALKEAWDPAAKSWSSTDRSRFHNDLGYAWTLDAVTDNVNSSKG
jgi:hypothetical protein